MTIDGAACRNAAAKGVAHRPLFSLWRGKAESAAQRAHLAEHLLQSDKASTASHAGGDRIEAAKPTPEVRKVNTKTLELTRFEPRHLDGALALSCAAGWPQRLEGWAASLSVSKGVVALHGDRVAGTALFGDTAATAKLIIVDRQLRGRGLGRRLTIAPLALACDRTCSLVTTAEGLPLCEKHGFSATRETYQHQGNCRSRGATGRHRVGRPAMPARFGCIRQRGLWRGPAGPADADRREREIRCAAPCCRDHRLRGRPAVWPGSCDRAGPGPDEKMARQLIHCVAASRKGQFLRIEVPGDSGLSQWLAGLGFPYAGSGIAMTCGDSDSSYAHTPQTFALATQAFG